MFGGGELVLLVLAPLLASGSPLPPLQHLNRAAHHNVHVGVVISTPASHYEAWSSGKPVLEPAVPAAEPAAIQAAKPAAPSKAASSLPPQKTAIAGESNLSEGVDQYKQFLSDKSMSMFKKTDELSEQMARLEDELGSKLEKLEEQLEDKMKEEQQLRKLMKEKGIKDGDDSDPVGNENIVEWDETNMMGPIVDESKIDKENSVSSTRNSVSPPVNSGIADVKSSAAVGISKENKQTKANQIKKQPAANSLVHGARSTPTADDKDESGFPPLEFMSAFGI